MKPDRGKPLTHRQRIDAAALAWMKEVEWDFDEDRFDRLARDVFAYQFENCAPYARFCVAKGVRPESIGAWHHVPAVPTGAFKELRLACFPESQTRKTFRTSGTSEQNQGQLQLDTLDLYEASLTASLARFVFPDLANGGRMALRILAPSAEESPDSSLSHMFRCALECFGDRRSGFDVVDGQLRAETLFGFLEETESEGRPVALCGTAFAFVHLLEALDKRSPRQFRLPPGSRVMETGGYKGRSRELPRETLHALLASRLGVAASHVLNQYGMTELGSQFYDSSLRETGTPRRMIAPPWTRLRVVDPETGDEAPDGSPGMVVIFDLANTGSIAAIETADIGRRRGDGFEILGREPGAEERGCSIAADLMLGEAPLP